MDLTYKELSKRDVINVADGRCLGKITDASFSFPQGVLTGIFVPVRTSGLFWFLNKSTLFISVNKIIRIGGDVILVDIRCGDNCLPSTTVGNKPQGQPKPNRPQPPCGGCSPCPPPCPPKSQSDGSIDLSGLFDSEGRINLDDY